MTDTKTLHIRNPEESHLCSGLYIVPTPIGNLRDITLRALDVLNAADVIVCEDSRVTGKLLKAYDLKITKKVTYNDHADEATKDYILKLARDHIVVMVSDAGTPLISDPGYKLVRDAVVEDVYVTALPGANAILPALQLSGMPTDVFLFAGFLPPKDKGVRDELKKYTGRKETCVFYESPKRIEKTLNIIAELMPDRRMAIVREISKLYEQSLRGTASEILSNLSDQSLKGEMAIVIDGSQEDESSYDIDELIRKSLSDGERVKDLSVSIACLTGLKKKEIYNRALELQKSL